MIDTSVGSTCKFCGKPVEQVPGRRKREFCNDACRQRHHRAKKQPLREQDQAPQGNTFTMMLSELVELRAKVADQEHMIENQAEVLGKEIQELRTKVSDQADSIEKHIHEIARLRERLDVERRYLQDNKQRGFKAFLKMQPTTPLIEKLLADQFFMPRDTRAHYEYRLARLQGTDEEKQEFTQLWKLMLLQQP